MEHKEPHGLGGGWNDVGGRGEGSGDGIEGRKVEAGEENKSRQGAS